MLLVTHQLQFVHQADHVVVMADGAIVERGAYDELVAKARAAPSSSSWSRTTARTKTRPSHEAARREPPERPSPEAEASRTGGTPPSPAPLWGDDDAAEDEDARNEEEGRIGEVTESAAAERGASRGEAPAIRADERGAAVTGDSELSAKSSSRWRPWTRAT